LPDISFYILVCGGDGTVNWILESIENTTSGVNYSLFIDLFIEEILDLI